MSTIANAKVAHNYNRYNGYFFGCLLISFRFYAKVESIFTRYNMHFFGGLPALCTDFQKVGVPKKISLTILTNGKAD